MQVHTFIADSAADAVRQIRSELGPQAVVLNVRPLPAEGLSRLWQKPRIEVLAHVPEPAEGAAPENPDTVAELRQELSAIKQLVGGRETPLPATSGPAAAAVKLQPGPAPAAANWPEAALRSRLLSSGGWRVREFLEKGGLLPVHAQRVVEELRNLHGDQPPLALAAELQLTQDVFRDLWNGAVPAAAESCQTHVFVGPPGVGKTVCLCKWLAHAVLVQSQAARVWRLDGRVANTAESLSVYSDILNTPVERSIPPDFCSAGRELLFIDIPGVNWNDAAGLVALGQQLGQLPAAQVHLVLNAAYETNLLLAQARAFAALPVHDLIFTHLDEEMRWGKLWNILLGTNFSVRFLSAGQNIPGEWLEATSDRLLARQFAAN